MGTTNYYSVNFNGFSVSPRRFYAHISRTTSSTSLYLLLSGILALRG